MRLIIYIVQLFCSHNVCCDLQDELLQELEELEQEEVEKDLLEVGPPSTELPGLDNLPEVRKYFCTGNMYQASHHSHTVVSNVISMNVYCFY